MVQQNVPILNIGKNLLVPIEIELTDAMVEDIYYAILKKIEESKSTGLIIDVSLVEVIDSFFARMLINIGRAAYCLNCDTIIVGITPEVAITLTQMGLEWRSVKTALTLDEAINLLQK